MGRFASGSIPEVSLTICHHHKLISFPFRLADAFRPFLWRKMFHPRNFFPSVSPLASKAVSGHCQLSARGRLPAIHADATSRCSPGNVPEYPSIGHKNRKAKEPLQDTHDLVPASGLLGLRLGLPGTEVPVSSVVCLSVHIQTRIGVSA